MKDVVVSGVVEEALPNATFLVELEDKRKIQAYLGGKMRFHHIRVMIGDKVDVQLDPYAQRGRIVRRY